MDQNTHLQDLARDAALRSIAIIASGGRSDFAAVFAPSAVNHESANEPPSCRGVGPQAFHETAIWLRDAFEGLVHEIEHSAVDGDLVAVDTTMKGRHTGPFVLYDADGRIDTAQAPTGRSFTSRQTHWFRVTDGQARSTGPSATTSARPYSSDGFPHPRSTCSEAPKQNGARSEPRHGSSRTSHGDSVQ